MAGAEVTEEGRLLAAVEEGAKVVPGKDTVEEGTTFEDGATGTPGLEGAFGAPDDGTSGTGGLLFNGAVAVDSTDVAGGAGGKKEPGGVGAGLLGLVAHSETVMVTVVTP